MKVNFLNKASISYIVKSTYWFAVGFILAGALLSSAVLFYFQSTYKNRVIPGVFIDNIYIGEKTEKEVRDIFNAKNNKLGNNTIIFSAGGEEATVSAKDIKMGYDVNLIADQSINLGKTKSLLTDTYLILASYINGTFLDATYTVDDNLLQESVKALNDKVYKEPVNAEFKITNNRVVAFKESEEGRSLDLSKLNEKVRDLIPQLAKRGPGVTNINIPIAIVEPQTTTEEANNFGIVEEIGRGQSTFYHSIPSRVHNISLAASRINGALIAPGEEFSFDKTLGDVSKFTGYQEAYVISGGKTVLGDGGGVCQVSTTLFRAILDAGLPITERHAHAYRVGYYEQDEPPGLDATIYVPTVDLKFKNDTGNYILIQTYFDAANMSLQFSLFGKSDGRIVEMTKPVLTSQSPAPEPLYQDDPTLPAGVIKQVDFAAPGGRSVFTRKVTKNGKVIIDDTFVSNYKPWQAVFLKGTGPAS